MTASLYDRIIPPFYLQERFTTASGDSAKRLHYLASYLNLEGINMKLETSYSVGKRNHSPKVVCTGVSMSQ